MPEDHNPYAGRDHENTQTPNNLRSIAALVGNVSGQLKDIDKKIVGGQNNQFTQALKMDPTQVVKSIVGAGGPSPAVPPPAPVLPPEPASQPAQQIPQPPPPPPPTPEPVPVPTAQPGEIVYSPGMEELIKRIDALESALDKTNRALKFKRGISYNINTATIKGNFKNPNDIVDIVLAELAKNTKTITIKLEDANKARK